MKIQTLNVNKTPEQPAGVDIDIVLPENPMEQRLLGFLLTLYLRDVKRERRVTYELPDRFNVNYQGEGRFIAATSPGEGSYYEPPKPVCLVGLREVGGRFDLIHAPLGQPAAGQPVATQALAAAETPPAAEAPPATEAAPAATDTPPATEETKAAE
jgi:hypothetical protein